MTKDEAIRILRATVDLKPGDKLPYSRDVVMTALIVIVLDSIDSDRLL